MAELKKRKDGRYQRRVTLSNGKTKLVYGRTKAQKAGSAELPLLPSEHFFPEALFRSGP